MEIPTGAQGRVSKGLLLSATILALWLAPGSTLSIRKIPEHPHRNQDLLLSVEGVPDTFQEVAWYLGEEPSGSTRLFSYFPDLQLPQRDGNAMQKRDITGFPNGSMLLRHAQPEDSGTYRVTVTISHAWSLKAEAQVQVAEKHEDPPSTHLPMSTGLLAAIIVGSLALGALVLGSFASLLMTRGCMGQSHRSTDSGKAEVGHSHSTDVDNVYEVMPSPTILVSPLSDTRSLKSTVPLPPPLPLQFLEPQNQHYQDLLTPDPAPYCQLVPAPP
ncbi:carcinoembryonic antigen-related cell adhesion molecule 19 [Sorex araneus]|uniref:carcinoembryonic antigen-related cell adhesion molecule 19 n=1 Tax=Sorex araneus TaxID=42254 RepID=UPI0003318302|nr:carcinoembryonic antigen-related cell adhesion molecule 19 [Sorex araneus]